MKNLQQKYVSAASMLLYYICVNVKDYKTCKYNSFSVNTCFRFIIPFMSLWINKNTTGSVFSRDNLLSVIEKNNNF